MSTLLVNWIRNLDCIFSLNTFVRKCLMCPSFMGKMKAWSYFGGKNMDDKRRKTRYFVHNLLMLLCWLQ